MSVVEGFEVLTGTYLGQDWEIFGATPDEAVVNYARYHHDDIAIAIEALESLVNSSMSEQELDKHWIYELHSGYDPRDDGFTYREWFAHALALLQAEAERSD